MSTTDKNRRGSQDRSDDEPEIVEISYIVVEYDVSEDEAREAIRSVGNNREDVEGYFRDRGQKGTGRGRIEQQRRESEDQRQSAGKGGETEGQKQSAGNQPDSSRSGGKQSESSRTSGEQQSGRMENDPNRQSTSGQPGSSSGQQTGGTSGESGRQSGSGQSGSSGQNKGGSSGSSGKKDKNSNL